MKIIAKALAGAATGITVASLAGAGFLPATATAATGLPGASPMLTRAPYLTDLTQTSVQVNWATAGQGTGSVGYGPAGDCSATTVTAPATSYPITVKATTEYQNTITITGLTPGTSYCYWPYSGTTDLLGTVSPPRFTTLQPIGSTVPFTFDVV